MCRSLKTSEAFTKIPELSSEHRPKPFRMGRCLMRLECTKCTQSVFLCPSFLLTCTREALLRSNPPDTSHHHGS